MQLFDLEGVPKAIAASDLEQLYAALRGPCLTPSDAEYEEARKIWNGMVDVRPSLIVQASGVADVIEAVNFAREQRVLTAIRGGGHNVAGNSLVDGGLVIDLAHLRHVHVDAARRRAWVGGGCTLGDVDRETQVHGLAAPLGVVSETGVAGLTLCGGYGWLRHRHGLACDAVRTFEVVTADGRVVHASEEQHPDLFWALRGGGGNFGVVTGFEFELYPVGPEVVLVGIAYPIESAAKVIPAWRDFMSQAPPELATNCLLWTLPDSEALPVEGRGQAICMIGGCWTGPVDEGLELLRPLRELGEPVVDLTGPMSWCQVQTAFDPFFEKGKRRNYWKSVFFDRFDDETVNHIVARAVERPDPWALVAIWNVSGSNSKVREGGGSQGNRDAPWLFSLDTGWEDPAKDERCVQWTRSLWDSMKAFSSTEGCYLNFPGLGEEGDRMLRASYGEENYSRLRRIKAEWDPENLFRMNQNIAPADS